MQEELVKQLIILTYKTNQYSIMVIKVVQLQPMQCVIVENNKQKQTSWSTTLLL